MKALQAAPINRLITFSGSLTLWLHAGNRDQLETEAHIQGEHHGHLLHRMWLPRLDQHDRQEHQVPRPQ